MTGKPASSLLTRDAGEIVLASSSASRAALLAAAGVPARRAPSGVDETAVRALLEESGGSDPADMAEVLARAKAEAVSDQEPGALVIGADQVLALEGEVFEKPADMAAARRTLLALRGRTHQLHACAAVALAGESVWTHTETAHLTMRDFEPAFVGEYLAQAGEAVLDSVGAYQLEALGVHLFERVDGDFFTILGLPLLPLLAFLRREGAVLA